MKLTEAVGKRIVMLLEEKHLSQYRLCSLGGISRSSVNLIINGKVNSPTMDTIYQIAATLGMSLAEFFDHPIFNEVTD